METDHSAFRFVQPMPDGYLLAQSRQSGEAPNAQVCDAQGRVLREFALGDGIADIQTTASGEVWVSYFDEGVFGDTIGSSGLVRFAATGSPLYRFQPSAGLDDIADCYALNVDSETTAWLCYYTEFPLVRVRKDVVDGVWNTGLAGASVMAVHDRRVVMHTGYNHQDWRRLELHNHSQVRDLGSLDFVDESGDALPVRTACARGGIIWFLRNSTVYRADIRQCW